MIERRTKAAKYFATMSRDNFDSKVISALNKMQVRQLARCNCIETRQNFIAVGPSGAGKTFSPSGRRRSLQEGLIGQLHQLRSTGARAD
ncbi:MAG: ATP-binding protein [Pseudomonadota bacterium]